MKHGLTACLLAFAAVLSAQAQTARKLTLPLSDDGKAEMTVYLPEHPRSSGMAIVDCPGGGYSHLSMENEGHNWAPFFNENGVAYCVLQYRMPKGDRSVPLTDAYKAMQTVRDSATVWHINPAAVGIMGFSAGGHLASSVSTHAPMAVRPDFSILFYPVISMDQKVTHKGSCVNFLGDGLNDEQLIKEWSNHRAVRRHLTPPAIILLASDDRAVPPVTNGIAYYSAMRNAGNDCSLFAWPSGGHGFGFRTTFAYHEQMKVELLRWLDTLRLPQQGAKKIACVGNSITDGMGIDMAGRNGYPAVLGKLAGEGYVVKNFGVSSRTAIDNGDLPYRKEKAWRDCLDWQPDIVVIKLGTNDTKEHNRNGLEKTYPAAVQKMIDELRALPSSPRIFLASPIPAFKSSWTINDSIISAVEVPALKKLSKKNKCGFIDLHTLFAPHSNLMQKDGIHPTDKGAAKIAEIVAEAVLKN